MLILRRHSMKMRSIGVILLMVYLSILNFIFKPYVQTKLNLNNKNASFIVVISVFSFGIGAIVMSITNYFDKKSDKK